MHLILMDYRFNEDMYFMECVYNESKVYNDLLKRKEAGEILNLDDITYFELYDMVANYVTNDMLANLYEVSRGKINAKKCELNCRWYEVQSAEILKENQDLFENWINELVDRRIKKMYQNIPEENNIIYHITLDQATAVAKHFGKDVNNLEEYEICELLDKIIDEEL